MVEKKEGQQDEGFICYSQITEETTHLSCQILLVLIGESAYTNHEDFLGA